MSANPYSLVTAQLVTELQSLSASYGGLVVQRKQMQADRITDFTRYSIVVSPANRPWGERTTSTRTFQYRLRVDLNLLVKNWDDEAALFGTTAPDLGLFEFVRDVKELIRATRLNGLLDKRYEESAGEVDYGSLAIQAFDSGEYTHVYRARVPFEGLMAPFCQPITPP